MQTENEKEKDLEDSLIELEKIKPTKISEKQKSPKENHNESTKVEMPEIKEIPNMKNGIIICKFDELKGYITSAKYPNFSNSELEKLIAKNAINFGDKIDLNSFKIKNITFYSKKFSIKSEKARGGEEVYSLIIYTNDIETKIEQQDLDNIINNLAKNPDNIDKQIQTAYSEFFNEIIPTYMAYLGNSFQTYKEVGNKRIPILEEKKVYLDLTKPSTIVNLGKKGSGKSYTTRGFIEEALDNNPDISLIVVDKPGTYYTLKDPNTNKDEFRDYPEITPRGYADKVVVFIPKGRESEVDANTYDALLSLMPSQVSIQTWCHIFDLDDTQPLTLLLDDIIKELKGMGNTNYSLDDIIGRIEYHGEQQQNVRNALFNKLKWASNTGLFDNKGLNLDDICRPGICSVIDVSFCDRRIATLIVAFFVESLMTQRKLAKRKQERLESGKEIDLSKYSLIDIPPTMLILEEAHNYLPATGKTKNRSLESLEIYIKECRGAGLGIFLISQEPRHLNTTALTQTDIVIVHRLTARQDIKPLMDILPGDPYEGFEHDIRIFNEGEAAIIMDTYLPTKVKIRPTRTIHKQRTEYTPTTKVDKEQVRNAFNISKAVQKSPVLDYWNKLEQKKREQLEEEEIRRKNQLLKVKEKELKQREKEIIKKEENLDEDIELEKELESLETEESKTINTNLNKSKKGKIEKTEVINKMQSKSSKNENINEDIVSIIRKIDDLIESGKYNTAKTRCNQLKLVIKDIEDKDARKEYEKQIKEIEKTISRNMGAKEKIYKKEEKEEEIESKLENMDDKKREKLEKKKVKKEEEGQAQENRIDNTVLTIFSCNKGSSVSVKQIETITHLPLNLLNDSIKRLEEKGLIKQINPLYYTFEKELQKRIL